MIKFLTHVAPLAVAALSFANPLAADLNPANSLGVTVGHVHFNVRDIDAAQKLFLDVGGAAINARFKGVDFPGVVVRFTKADPTGPSEGATLEGVGFAVKDGAGVMARMQADGAKVAYTFKNSQGKVNGGTVISPDGVTIVITPQPQLSEAARFDRIIFSVADPGPNGGAGWSELQKWYSDMFDVTVQTSNLVASSQPGGSASAQSDLDGIRFSFGKAATQTTPTKGRAIDHFGFEIINLEAFCQRLESKGIKFDDPYRKGIGDMGIAFIVDPIGTRIELNEGFAVKNL